MNAFVERDAQISEMIRREIGKRKHDAKNCGWGPDQHAWHRTFGEISGMHRILSLIDPNANDVLPPLPEL